MKFSFIISFILLNINLTANADICSQHPPKKFYDYSANHRLSLEERKVLDKVSSNTIRFSKPEGSGFIMGPLDSEQSLILTASHIARMKEMKSIKPNLNFIGFPSVDGNITSNRLVNFSFTSLGSRMVGERVYTPIYEFSESKPAAVAYQAIWKSIVLDFTFIKSSTSKIKQMADEMQRPLPIPMEWIEPKLGQKVMVVAQDTISIGCIDLINPDLTFEMTATGEDGLSGGMVVDAETGDLIGILTAGFYNKVTEVNDGSGGVSISSMLRVLEEAQLNPAMIPSLAQLAEKIKEKKAK